MLCEKDPEAIIQRRRGIVSLRHIPLDKLLQATPQVRENGQRM
jgi:hypothetical protein